MNDRIKAPGVLVVKKTESDDDLKRKAIREELTGRNLKLKGGARLDKPKDAEPWAENERIEYLIVLKKKMMDRFGHHREWMDNVPSPESIGKKFDENGRLVPIENDRVRVRV
jgi:hypothetical protein